MRRVVSSRHFQLVLTSDTANAMASAVAAAAAARAAPHVAHGSALAMATRGCVAARRTRLDKALGWRATRRFGRDAKVSEAKEGEKEVLGEHSVHANEELMLMFFQMVRGS